MPSGGDPTAKRAPPRDSSQNLPAGGISALWNRGDGRPGQLLALADRTQLLRGFPRARSALDIGLGGPALAQGLPDLLAAARCPPDSGVNTHLLANYDEDWAPGNRFAREQRKDLAQLADAIGRLDREALLIVAGDFNVPAMSPMFEEFTTKCDLRDAYAWAASTRPPTLRQSRSDRPGLVIDHVLYRQPTGQPLRVTARLRFEEPVRLASGRVAFPSDHIAVEADIVLDSRSRNLWDSSINP